MKYFSSDFFFFASVLSNFIKDNFSFSRYGGGYDSGYAGNSYGGGYSNGSYSYKPGRMDFI